MIGLHPVFQVVLVCAHAICAVSGIGDIHFPVPFEKGLNLLSLKLLWFCLNFKLVELHILPGSSHKVQQLLRLFKAEGKLGYRGHRMGGLEYH